MSGSLACTALFTAVLLSLLSSAVCSVRIVSSTVVVVSISISISVAAAITAAVSSSISSSVSPSVSGLSSPAASPSSSAAWGTSHTTGTATSTSHGWWAEGIGLGCRFLNIDFFAVDDLFGGLEQVEDNVLIVVGDEAEVLALILDAIKGHFDFDYVSEGAKEGPDRLFSGVLGQTTNKDFAGAGFGLFGVNTLAIDDVLAGIHYLIKILSSLEHQESKSSGPSGLRIHLHSDAFDFAILSEVLTEFLVSRRPAETSNK